METENKHFLEILTSYSFNNCKKAYYFDLAGLKKKEIGRMISISRGGYKVCQVNEMIKGYQEALDFEEEIEEKRKVAQKKPWYERTLNSFANNIITRASKGKTCWYASLDNRALTYAFPPDFSTGADTREDAIRFCSLKLRLDALGVGKYAPHNVFKSIDFWNLKDFWRKKEYKIKK